MIVCLFVCYSAGWSKQSAPNGWNQLKVKDCMYMKGTLRFAGMRFCIIVSAVLQKFII